MKSFIASFAVLNGFGFMRVFEGRAQRRGTCNPVSLLE